MTGCGEGGSIETGNGCPGARVHGVGQRGHLKGQQVHL